jgi:uncharacterized repeat protein (TIGR04138 family)
MDRPDKAILKLAREDRRYHPAAYWFVFEALGYAQTVLGMGQESKPGPEVAEKPPVEEPDDESATSEKAATAEAGPERHITGQQLCEAIRLYALEQYGYMAKCVLRSWGIQRTGDFGEIVFNLISKGQMRKTPADRREDFDDVFDFDRDLQGNFRITVPKE